MPPPPKHAHVLSINDAAGRLVPGFLLKWSLFRGHSLIFGGICLHNPLYFGILEGCRVDGELQLQLWVYRSINGNETLPPKSAQIITGSQNFGKGSSHVGSLWTFTVVHQLKYPPSHQNFWLQKVSSPWCLGVLFISWRNSVTIN